MRTCIAAVLTALLLIASGCTTVIRPPARVEDPVVVFVVEAGWHAVVGIYQDNGRVVCFDYGEWEYYAKANHYWWRVVPAALWPTTGTLARCEVPVDGDAAPIDLITVRDWISGERGWILRVERAAAEALRAELEERFLAARATVIQDPDHNTVYVRDRESYHLFHTCNHEIKEWLRELGCEVGGPYWAWDYRVETRPGVDAVKRRSVAVDKPDATPPPAPP